MRHQDGLRGDSLHVRVGRTLQLANIANGRTLKDVRLEFVDWARDGRYQLTLEDDKVWLQMKVMAVALLLVDGIGCGGRDTASVRHHLCKYNVGATRWDAETHNRLPQ